ncbi:MAG: trypsin-like peptidase domain-containing protein [Bdellovibrionota bacterium]|mgnify:FL=1
MVFPVVRLSETGEPLEILGSCFSIAKGGLFITAGHLFQSFSEYQSYKTTPEILRKKPVLEVESHRVGIFRIRENEDGTISNELLKVHACVIFLDFDVGFLFVYGGGINSNTPILQVRERPKISETVKLIGYGKSKNWLEDNNGKKTYNFTLVGSNGVIIQEHENGIGNLMQYPIWETDAQLEHGQSGGPAIDMHTPAVLGINSGSFSSLGLNSYFSPIGKIVDVPFGVKGCSLQIKDGEKLDLEVFTLRQLATKELLKIID